MIGILGIDKDRWRPMQILNKIGKSLQKKSKAVKSSQKPRPTCFIKHKYPYIGFR